MTETKHTPEIPADAKLLVEGINLMFAGVGKILGAMEPELGNQLIALAKRLNPADTPAVPDIPADEAPKEQPKKKAPAKKQEPATALTADDLIKVVTGKIKQDRANKEKILALLKSYGAGKVSDIPQDKYEAFLTDVSAL